MLEATELKRRMDAARTLRGLTQAGLAALVHSDGLGKHDVGRLERGDIPLSRALKESLSRHLGVPPEWFTEPEFEDVIGHHDLEREEIRALLSRQSDILARIEAMVAVLPTPDELEEIRRAIDGDG